MIRRLALASGPSRVAALAVVALVIAAIVGVASGLVRFAPERDPILVGAVFPSDPSVAALSGPELEGVRIAASFVNADGGVAGRPIQLVERPLDDAADAPAVMADLARHGVNVVVGAYSSDLSIAASAAANAAGLVYWESGAVADQLTGRGLPLVFRVGANGATLGTNSSTFAAQDLAPRLGKSPSQLRVAIVEAQDAYAESVADAAATTASASGLDVVATISYNLEVPRWADVMAQLKAAHPDTIILASHIPDGVAFRQAMVASDLHVGALIGSTMAECDPDFAGDLGTDAIGIFASDRPTAGFNPTALDPSALALYQRFATAWAAKASTYAGASGDDAYGGSAATTSPSAGAGDGAWGDAGYALSGPAESTTAEQSEEALAGFSAAWALFHDVLPAATAGTPATSAPAPATQPDPQRVAAAARAIDLATGSLPNGAGLKFSSEASSLGQNERAAAVIWQWQAVRQYAFVWPPSYATASIIDVPLTR